MYAAAVNKELPIQTAAQITSLLAVTASAGLPVREAVITCLKRVADDTIATLTRDIVLGTTVSVRTALLNAASAVR